MGQVIKTYSTDLIKLRSQKQIEKYKRSSRSCDIASLIQYTCQDGIIQYSQKDSIANRGYVRLLVTLSISMTIVFAPPW